MFETERKRILQLLECSVEVEHVGSTAVPGLGGKGIIDIAIIASKQDFESVSQHLQNLGYEFKSNFSTSERLFFVIFLPDAEEEVRTYHVHLTYFDSKEWNELLGFREYLRMNSEVAKEYADVKKQAVIDADGDGKKYMQFKEPIFKKAQIE